MNRATFASTEEEEDKILTKENSLSNYGKMSGVYSQLTGNIANILYLTSLFIISSVLLSFSKICPRSLGLILQAQPAPELYDVNFILVTIFYLKISIIIIPKYIK